MQERIEKNLSVFEKIASELVVINCLCEADNLSH